MMMNLDSEDIPRGAKKPKSKLKSQTSVIKSKIAEACIEHRISVSQFVPSDLADVLPDNFSVQERGTELHVQFGSNMIRFTRASLSRLVRDKARNMGWSDEKIESLIAAADA